MKRRRPKRPPGMPQPILALRADWSPEQAQAVFELLDELRDRVWDFYGLQIQQALRAQRRAVSRSRSHDLDDPPF